jgi:antitoxin component HigA of HigAB toxin-antitoxin module
MTLLTKEEYVTALDIVEQYFNKELLLGSPERDYFEILVNQIEAYENHHFPIFQVWENDGGTLIDET